MKNISLIIVILFQFSFVASNRKLETGFSKDCIKLEIAFRKSDHGKLIYNKTNKVYIQSKVFAKTILNLTRFDFDEKELFKIEKKTSKKFETIVWKNIDNSKKLVKQSFSAKPIEGQSLTITDYVITQKIKPNYIHLRMIEDEFEELRIDKTIYNSSYFESRLVGADEAIEELKQFGK